MAQHVLYAALCRVFFEKNVYAQLSPCKFSGAHALLWQTALPVAVVKMRACTRMNDCHEQAMGAYQLGGMPGGDPYAAFGVQPNAAMLQVYNQVNDAAPSSLMRLQGGPPPQQPGAASGNPSGGATSAHAPAPAPASGSSAPQPVMNGKQASTPAAEGDGVVAVDKGGDGEEGESRCCVLAASLMLPCC